MKVVLYGDFKPTRLATSYQRAFEQLNCQVIPFDTNGRNQNVAFWLRNRLLHRVTINSLNWRSIGAKQWNQQLLQAVKSVDPDLLFIINGDFIMPDTIKRIQQAGVKVFIFHADNPFPPHYNNRPETLLCAVESDAYFIWSRQLVARLNSIGVRHAYYLPFAWDPEVFPYAPSDDQYDYDLVFIGGWDKQREDFLEMIAEKFDLKIWGPDYWQTRTKPGSLLHTCWQGKSVVGQEAAHILQRSRIALNIVREQNLPDGVIMRTFELPGCGAFGLSTRTDGALEIFPEGIAGSYFETIEECVDQIKDILLNELFRNKLLNHSHYIVKNMHTYTDRVKFLTGIYNQLCE